MSKHFDYKKIYKKVVKFYEIYLIIKIQSDIIKNKKH